MRTISIFIFLVLNGLSLTSQDYQIKWDVSLGTPDHDNLYDAFTTSDDNFLFVARADDAFGNGDYHIIKTDQKGMVLWERSYGGDGHDFLSAVIETPEGGFLLGGYSRSFTTSPNSSIGHFDYWLLKVNAEGVLEWEQSYGGPLYDIMRTMVANDKGYLLVGSKHIDDGGSIYRDDAFVVQVDHSGNLLWEKRYGGSLDDRFHSAIVMDDNNFLFSGITKSNDGNISNNYGSQDIWVVCTNADGELLWEKTFGGSAEETIGYSSMKQSSDGNYLLCGNTGSSDHDLSDFSGKENALVFKIDAQGEILWSYAYGHEFGESLSDVKELGDNELLLFGDRNTTEGFITLSNYWMLVIDQEDGKIKSEQMFGGSSNERGIRILEDKDEYIVLSGISNSSDGDITNSLGLNDIWVACIDLKSTNVIESDPVQDINVYPNPTSEIVYIDMLDDLDFFTNVYDINGKLVIRNVNESTVDFENLPSGMYFIEIREMDSEQRWMQRIVRE